jgi:endonuclease/exonuclease/phosphatase family metal-dependent hydrolase
MMVLAHTGGAAAASPTTDIVLYAAEAPVVQGNWVATASDGAAAGRAMASADLGWSSTNTPLASPSNYFELTFEAPAGTGYRVWLRMRAAQDSKWNDSVWVQFSDAILPTGEALHRIGTPAGLMVNLEACAGCGTSAWGWQNSAYWLTQTTEVQFAAAGTQTMRVQTREDGVAIDQIVLSPVSYRSTAPGPLTGDTTILPAQPPLGDDVVLYASDALIVHGHWSEAASSGAAGGRSMTSADLGWSTLNAPLVAPANYFELTFDAPAGKTFRIWLRLRAAANSKWNDAVWVQFSDATLPAGAAIYRIGTTSALMVNLERCSGCGTSGWGWQNTAYWLTQPTEIRFATSGRHTMRVQTREDGVEVDQIVLSAAAYRSTPPGPLVDDATILPATQRPGQAKSPSESPPSTTPYLGTPFVLPGTVDAADFDDGGQEVAYRDSTPGNAGNSYRQSDVDIQPASVGGYNIGWTEAGEWLKYSVDVAAAADYIVQVRVAATSARTIEVGVGGVSATASVPNTGNWQAWTTVAVPMTLAAGPQTMTIGFPSGGVNLRSITVASAPSPPPASGTPTGGRVRVMTWNIQQGHTRAGVYDPVAQATFIASQNPDVVLLQEINTSMENQPARYKALLEQLTGQSWFVQWAPIMDSRPTEGNVVMTRLPVTSSASHQMHATDDWTTMYANRSVAEATVLVGGVPVHMFSTHLDYYNTTHRTAQLLDMMAWAETFGPRRIVGGDFNSWWGEYWIVTMMADYYDTWQDVMKTNQKGYTVNDAVRFDYLFRAKDGSGQVWPTAVQVPPTTLSDHYPVVADYGVTP